MNEFFEYEYTVVELNDCYTRLDFDVAINDNTDNGWEFVQILLKPGCVGTYFLFLKRVML